MTSESRVEGEVRRAALGQLLRGAPLAELLHVVLVLVVAALVWDSLPLALTVGWVGAVTAAAAIRALRLDQAAMILVVLAGLVAGATGTLVGDRRSFHYLLFTVLVAAHRP